MKALIQSKLCEIEASEGVKIIYAAESGSRGWGFASPDSDYDVRFIYVRDAGYYLKLEKTRDVIEWQLDETLDISGWDLQKALRLLHNSNPTLFEWSNSPIVYKETDEWAEVRSIINDYFLDKAGLYHYLNTANSNYRAYLKGDQVRLKNYFYVLRPLLACKWILENKCPPPMLFSALMDAMLEAELKPALQDLISKKMSTSELGQGNRIDSINAYIDHNLHQLKMRIDALPADQKKGWDELNRLFMKLVM